MHISKAVTVQLAGGLGNQLFQYATGRCLAERHGARLLLDLSWFDAVRYMSDTTARHYALAPFQLDVALRRSWFARTRWSYQLRSFAEAAMHKYGCRLGQPILRESGYGYDDRVTHATPPLVLRGYWQSWRYFSPIADLLRSELGQPRAMSDASCRLMEEIQTTQAICLHVRRGDYVSNIAASQTHALCDISYYRRGIELATTCLRQPHGYVFTDDPQWAREHLRLDLPLTVVDINGPDDAHQDLWLMAACQRFVIANSSLSWWGAWLGAHSEKVVVAPREWFTGEERDTSDLTPPDWKRV